MSFNKVGLALAISSVPFIVVRAEFVQWKFANWQKPILILWWSNTFCVPILGTLLVFQGLIGKDRGVFSHIKRMVLRMTSGWDHGEKNNPSWMSFASLILLNFVLKFVSIACYYVGLEHASVTELEALSQLKTAFTIMILSLFLRQKVWMSDVTAAFVSLIGVALFALSVSRGSTSRLDVWGAICGLCDALGFACYGVIVKTVFSSVGWNESIVMLFLEGVANIFPGCLFIVLSSYTGIENFALPDSAIFGSLCLVAFIHICVNVSYLLAVALIGPTPTSIISTSRIAVGAVTDYLVYKKIMTSWEWVACACILAGFFITTLAGVMRADTKQEVRYEEPFMGSLSKTRESINTVRLASQF